MAYGKNIRTYFEGAWHEGNLFVMRAADHGSWLGSTVFDGARYFEGIAPDLDLPLPAPQQLRRIDGDHARACRG